MANSRHVTITRKTEINTIRFIFGYFARRIWRNDVRMDIMTFISGANAASIVPCRAIDVIVRLSFFLCARCSPTPAGSGIEYSEILRKEKNRTANRPVKERNSPNVGKPDVLYTCNDLPESLNRQKAVALSANFRRFRFGSHG